MKPVTQDDQDDNSKRLIYSYNLLSDSDGKYEQNFNPEECQLIPRGITVYNIQKQSTELEKSQNLTSECKELYTPQM